MKCQVAIGNASGPDADRNCTDMLTRLNHNNHSEVQPMADAATAADQAATVANMQPAAQHTPPPEEKHNAVSNSLETHQSLQVLHQRLAQPQAQQPSAPLQQSSTMTHPAGSGMPSTSAYALFSTCTSAWDALPTYLAVSRQPTDVH